MLDNALKKNAFFEKVVTVDFNKIQRPYHITFINHASYLAFRHCDTSHYSHIGLDGALLTKMLSWCRETPAGLARTSFDATSVGIDFFKYNPSGFGTVVTIGGNKEEAELFAAKVGALCHADLKLTSVSGFLQESGFASWEDYLYTLNRENKPDVVIIGLGFPLQERISKLLYDLDANISTITCGAFISQTASADGVSYYPTFIDRLSLRWLWRFFRERHVRSRLLLVYPQAIFRSIIDVIETYVR